MNKLVFGGGLHDVEESDLGSVFHNGHQAHKVCQGILSVSILFSFSSGSQGCTWLPSSPQILTPTAVLLEATFASVLRASFASTTDDVSSRLRPSRVLQAS